MKKLLCTTLSLMFFICLFAVSVSAKSEGDVVYVSIADHTGTLVLTAEPVTVTGNATIHDALTAAHDAYYKGTDGYAASESAYGLSMDKLWGIDGGGAYGYCVNNVSAMSLYDPVKAGDHVYAYIYRDVLTYADSYSYFDVLRADKEKGDILTLTLSRLTYDENWNTVTEPVAGATILLNGERTYLKTDENGKVTVPCDKSGDMLVSAEHATLVLVPPVCIVSVPTSVTPIILAIVAAVVVLGAVAFFVVKTKKKTK